MYDDGKLCPESHEPAPTNGSGLGGVPATGGEAQHTRPRTDQRTRNRLSCLAVAVGILIVDALAWLAVALLGGRAFGWWGE